MVQRVKERHVEETRISRRGFLNKIWMMFGVIAVIEFAWVVLSFLRKRPESISSLDADALFTVGRIDQFKRNSVTAFPRGHFYLVCLENGGFLALSRRCTHLGCTLPWVEKEKKFVCPCHSSIFDIQGAVVQSPAPRAMDLLSLRIENQLIKVDTRLILRRDGFHKDQVVYPV